MARLPNYDSQQGLTTQPGSVQRDINAEQQAGRNIQNIGKAAEDIANVWQDAKDFTETLRSQNILDNGQNEIFKKAQEDPDYENSAVYHEDLNRVREASLEGFSNNLARQKFQVTAQNQSAAASIKIDGLFRSKHIDYTKAEIIRSHEKNHAAYIAGDLTAKGKQAELVSGAFEKGFVNAIFVANEDVKFLGWDYDRAIYDAQNGDAEEVARIVQEGKTYDIKNIGAAVKEINSLGKIKKDAVKRQTKEKQVSNELDITKSLLEAGIDGISNEQIISLAGDKEDGDIRQKFSQALIEYKNDPRVYRKSFKSDKAFDGYVRAILESNNKDAINNILLDILSKKEVKKDNLTVLFQIISEKSASVLGLAEDEGETIGAKKEIIDSVIGVMTSKDIPEEEKSERIKQVVESSSKGMKSQESIKIAERQAVLKAHPVVRTYPKDGMVKTDKHGNRVRFFPDGSKKAE